jgi:hypothetical protein
VGPTSQREKGGRQGTGSGGGRLGCGLLSLLGRNGSPWPFILFSFSFSFPFLVFLFLFLSFAKKLQFNSNFFQKFCKIQGKVLNQQQTCF